MHFIHINDCQVQGYADFIWNKNCKGDTTQFINQTTYQEALYWKWNFGDGLTSDLKNPTHTYSDTGHYNVMMIVSDSGFVHSDTVKKDIYITICEKPYIEAGWDKTCKGDTTKFRSNTTHPGIVNWNWDFGDGFTSTLQNPIHIFSDTGKYQVSLTVSDSGAVNSHSISILVRITRCGSSGPVGNFSWDKTCNGDTTYFFDEPVIIGSWAVWRWSFGDGTTSNEENPKHIYADTGNYEVTLLVSYNGDSLRPDTLSKNIHINDCYALAHGNFNMDNTCFGLASKFTTVSILNGNFQYMWDFGDGSTSTEKDPSHTYAEPGTYIVKEIIIDVSDSNHIKSDTILKAININKVLINAGEDITICKGSNANLVATGNAIFFNWSTGDTTASINVSPVSPSTYSVTGLDSNGCSAIDVIAVYEAPAMLLTFSKNNASCGNSDGSASVSVLGGIAPLNYKWSNGDTVSSITNLNATSYSLTVRDSLNCSASGFVNIGNLNGPSLDSVTSSNSSCPKSADGTAAAQAKGGKMPYNYLWNTQPAQTGNMATGLSAGTYTLTVKDSSNCTASISVVVEATGKNPSLSGKAYLSKDNAAVKAGLVQLYHINNSGVFSIVGVSKIDTNGTYQITDLPVGDFVLAVFPDTSVHPFAIKTYYNFQHKWDQGDTIKTLCDQNKVIDLKVIDLSPMNGKAKINGIIADVTGGKRASNPLPGVDVSLEEEPEGIIVASTKTDSSGFYQFENVEQGKFKIIVDIPGLDMAATYSISVESDDTASVENNYFVDSTGVINTIYTPNNVSSNVQLNRTKVSTYPNPYSGTTTIKYSINERSLVILEVYNLIGKRIALIENTIKQAGDYKYNFSAKAIGEPAGVYLIKLKINNQILTQKIIEMD